MKFMEKLIPVAIEAINEQEIPDSKTGEVANEFKGYIDTFGAMIVQNGLMPAAVFFEQDKDEKSSGGASVSANRQKLLKAILKVLCRIHENSLPDFQQKNIFYNYLDKTLKKNDYKSLRTLRAQVVEAATIIKLALRTFKFSKSESDHE